MPASNKLTPRHGEAASTPTTVLGLRFDSPATAGSGGGPTPSGSGAPLARRRAARLSLLTAVTPPATAGAPSPAAPESATSPTLRVTRASAAAAVADADAERRAAAAAATTRPPPSRFALDARACSLSSLEESKVLATNPAALPPPARTPSLLHPETFTGSAAFAFEARIGRSPTSDVWRAVHVATGTPYAIKTSSRPLGGRAARAAGLTEATATAGLPPHPNLVTVHRAWQEGGRLFLQMDLCGGGSVGRALRAVQAAAAEEAGGGAAALPEAAVWRVAAGGSAALAALADGGVVHLDVSPDNLYLPRPDGRGPVRLGDFGLAVRVADLQAGAAWEEGDGRYVAPEALAGGGSEDGARPAPPPHPGPPADVFSLGAALYHCLTGAPLPRGADAPRVGRDGCLALPDPLPGGRAASKPLARLLGAMLSPDPAARPAAAAVAQAAGAVVAAQTPAEATAAAAALAAGAARRPSWGGGGGEEGGGHGGPFGTVRLGVAESFDLGGGGSGGGGAGEADAEAAAALADDGGPACLPGCASPARPPHRRRRTPSTGSAPPSPPPAVCFGRAPARPALTGFFAPGAPLGSGAGRLAAIADLERAASAMSIDEDGPPARGPCAAAAGAGGRRAADGRPTTRGRPAPPPPPAMSSSDSFEVAAPGELAATVRALSMSVE